MFLLKCVYVEKEQPVKIFDFFPSNSFFKLNKSCPKMSRKRREISLYVSLGLESWDRRANTRLFPPKGTLT